MHCLRAIRGVRTDRLQNIKFVEDTFTPEPIRDVIRHKMLVVWACLPCQESTLLAKHSNKLTNDKERKTIEEVELPEMILLCTMWYAENFIPAVHRSQEKPRKPTQGQHRLCFVE